MAARRALNSDEERALAWAAQHEIVERDERRCHECGLPWSPAGFGHPGLASVAHAPERFYCTQHEHLGRAWHAETYGLRSAA